MADEVRKLAEQSAGAASEVTKQMKELQSKAQNSFRMTEETQAFMIKTVALGENALEGLEATFKHIARTSDAMQEIAAVAEEQASSHNKYQQASARWRRRHKKCKRHSPALNTPRLKC